MNRMNKERKNDKKAHDWRIEWASTAKEREKEAYKKEYKQQRIFPEIFQIVIKGFI